MHFTLKYLINCNPLLFESFYAFAMYFTFKLLLINVLESSTLFVIKIINAFELFELINAYELFCLVHLAFEIINAMELFELF